MRYLSVLIVLLLFACGSSRNEKMTQLLSEQKVLKDSANNINERIGGYVRRGVSDSAVGLQKQLGVVHGRLIEIQGSIDSIGKLK